MPGGAASSAAPAAAAAEAPKEPEPPKEERAASKEDALECLGEVQGFGVQGFTGWKLDSFQYRF